jgi:AcrR family transcriptional regulator
MERILDATERFLKNRPFREIGVAEIAQEAKAAPTSLYARFENKRALLGALFERHAAAQRKMIEELAAPDAWVGVPLANVLRRTLPVIVAGYRVKQGLIRAFLEQASEDKRFREDWGAVGDFIADRIVALVADRAGEIDHPDPIRGIKLCMDSVFATLALKILMRELDKSAAETLTEELIEFICRYMGITDNSSLTASKKARASS